MNLPNKLTVLRVIMVPFYLVFQLFDFWPGITKWIALTFFIAASVTDILDGKIARKYNLVTNFGKFMDPLADKLLVCSALISLTYLGRINPWIVIVIIAREFIISGFRLVAADNGVVIAASMWGKVKTVFQMIMIGMLIGNVDWIVMQILTYIVVVIATALTIISLIDYIVKNKDVLKA